MTASATRHPASKLSAAARIVVVGVGSTTTAVLAVLLLALWTVVGLTAGFRQHWLDLLYTVTGGITFIMVFLIQHTTGVQTRAVLLKLDELIRATAGARNDVIAAEQRSLHEQERLEERVTADA
jgi:low affinity Fe/Cu permease